MVKAAPSPEPLFPVYGAHDPVGYALLAAGCFVVVGALVLSLFPRNNKGESVHPVKYVSRSFYDHFYVSPNPELMADQVLKDTKNPVTWKNYWNELYVEAFGDEAFHTNMEKQFPLKPGYFGGRIGLWLHTLFIRFMMGLGARLSHKRPTHPNGVGATGTVKFLGTKHLPENFPFVHILHDKRVWNVRVRHANALGIFNHDAGFEPRSLSIKFADAEETSPFDLLLNTGEEMGFFNQKSFLEFVYVNLQGDNASQADFAKRYPLAYKALIGGFRRAPESYSHLHYYSQIPFEMEDTDGRKVICKFRAVPLTEGGPIQTNGPALQEEPEKSGLPDLRDQRAAAVLNTAVFGHPLIQQRNLASDYLTQDLKKRLEGEGTVTYKLQIQYFVFGPDDSHEVFNPNVAWERSEHPFYDIAVLTLQNVLEPRTTERLRFNVARLPVGLKLLDAVSPIDYNSIAYTRYKIYSYSQYQRNVGADPSKVAQSETRLPIAKYKVITRTGTDLFAETFDRIMIAFIGTNGMSSYVELMNTGSPLGLMNKFADGERSEFRVEAEDVGELYAVRIEKQGSIDTSFYSITIDAWQIESLRVTKNTEVELKFAAAAWVSGDRPVTFFRINIRTGSKWKDHYMSDMRDMWPFNRDKTLPLRGDYNDWRLLPLGTAFRYKALWSMGGHTLGGSVGYYLSLILDKMVPTFLYCDPDLVAERYRSPIAPTLEHKSIDFFRAVFLNPVSPFRLPERASRWRDDAEFANRFTTTNPLFLKGIRPTRVSNLPMPITEAMAKRVFTLHKMPNHSQTLASLIQEGKLFHIDYRRFLRDLPVYDGKDKKKKDKRPRYVAIAHALFYEHPWIGGRERLMPLAIQLEERKPDKTSAPVFLPTDDQAPDGSETYLWLAAKLHFQNADSQIHQFITHLFNTHLMIEPIVVSKLRNLPPYHPVSRLLHHHTQGIIAINTLGRQILIGNGSISDEVMSMGAVGSMQMMTRFFHKGFEGDGIVFVRDFHHEKFYDSRHVDGLNFFPYRDDGKILWHTIERYVDRFIRLHYPDDESIRADADLRAWLQDMKTAMSPIKLPGAFDSIQILASFVCCVIFRTSVGHAGVNFCQYDHYAHIPSAPLCLMRPPPSSKDHPLLSDDILDMMPPKDMLQTTLVNLNNLSSFAADEKFLGTFFDDMFADDDEQTIVKRFQEELFAIDEMMRVRIDSNKSAGICVSGDAYHYLRPSRIPNGIFI